MHQAQQPQRLLPRLGRAQPAVPADRLHELAADGVERVQRGHRLLEDHADPAAADPVELGLAQRQQVAAAIVHRAAGLAVGSQQPHRRHHGLALARAGLAHHRHRLAGVDVEVDALHRLDHAVQRAEADPQVPDLEDLLRRARPDAHVSGPSGRARRAGRRR